ncbi:hypothetical protein C3Y87_18610 [Carbonactinospora thermoautotrophica]|uniref:hypothetical protein n=1 Tax=Carbonactinospora thermoautotrophica TaxID=1469144 RepID=UPI0022718A9A|nr:hypothetical protein [Carbonactinospora thermoautotrophica]MCX9193377.1 hypothetical protein [Carbonactinospora thermoautotrophica]
MADVLGVDQATAVKVLAGAAFLGVSMGAFTAFTRGGPSGAAPTPTVTVTVSTPVQAPTQRSLGPAEPASGPGERSWSEEDVGQRDTRDQGSQYRDHARFPDVDEDRGHGDVEQDKGDGADRPESGSSTSAPESTPTTGPREPEPEPAPEKRERSGSAA